MLASSSATMQTTPKHSWLRYHEFVCRIWLGCLRKARAFCSRWIWARGEV